MIRKLGNVIEKHIDKIIDKNFEFSFLVIFGVLIPACLLGGLGFIAKVSNVFSFANSIDNIFLYFATTFSAGMSSLMAFVILKKTLNSNEKNLEEQRKDLLLNIDRTIVEKKIVTGENLLIESVKLKSSIKNLIDIKENNGAIKYREKIIDITIILKDIYSNIEMVFSLNSRVNLDKCNEKQKKLNFEKEDYYSLIEEFKMAMKNSSNNTFDASKARCITSIESYIKDIENVINEMNTMYYTIV